MAKHNINTTLTWNIEELAKALKINKKDVVEYFTDGRRASFIIERRLAKRRGWKIAPSENDSYDIIAPGGGKWEVRSLTDSGVYFTPSSQVGKGRKFSEPEFKKKLKSISGYIVANITDFPKVTIYEIPVANVKRWYNAGTLGVNAKVSKVKFLNELCQDII